MTAKAFRLTALLVACVCSQYAKGDYFVLQSMIENDRVIAGKTESASKLISTCVTPALRNGADLFHLRVDGERRFNWQAELAEISLDLLEESERLQDAAGKAVEPSSVFIDVSSLAVPGVSRTNLFESPLHSVPCLCFLRELLGIRSADADWKNPEVFQFNGLESRYSKSFFESSIADLHIISCEKFTAVALVPVMDASEEMLSRQAAWEVASHPSIDPAALEPLAFRFDSTRLKLESAETPHSGTMLQLLNERPIIVQLYVKDLSRETLKVLQDLAKMEPVSDEKTIHDEEQAKRKKMGRGNQRGRG